MKKILSCFFLVYLRFFPIVNKKSLRSLKYSEDFQKRFSKIAILESFSTSWVYDPKESQEATRHQAMAHMTAGNGALRALPKVKFPRVQCAPKGQFASGPVAFLRSEPTLWVSRRSCQVGDRRSLVSSIGFLS